MPDIGPSSLYIVTYFVLMASWLADTAGILISAWLADNSPVSTTLQPKQFQKCRSFDKFSAFSLPCDMKLLVVFICPLMDGQLSFFPS